ncbi:MAG: DMT family transporter [Planctomycetota bacterium]|jgi:drug/metabolite transporter (DMT)-like permease
MNPVRIRKFDAPPTFACLGVLVFWTIGPIIIKYLTVFLDVWTQNFLRYLFACLFWLPFLLFDIRRKRLERPVWQKAVLPASINVVMQSMSIAAYYYLNPGFLMLLLQSSVVWIAGFSLLLFKSERALVRSRRFWLGTTLCIVGVIGVLLFKADFTATKTLIGIAIALVAAILWAAYTISVKIAFKNIDSRRGFSVISIYTVIGLGVSAFIFGRPGQCLNMSPLLWGCVVISGILCIGLSHVLYYFAIKGIGATIPALILLLLPFTVLALSGIIFKEVLNVFQLVSGAVLLVGAGFAVWAQEHLE